MRGGVSATADCRDFYLDETGSSGDLVSSGAAFEFARQPVFLLACMVDDDEAGLAEDVSVRARHRLQGGELKSAALKNKPTVVH